MVTRVSCALDLSTVLIETQTRPWLIQNLIPTIADFGEEALCTRTISDTSPLKVLRRANAANFLLAGPAGVIEEDGVCC
jgi:hypothetical protein